MPPLPPVPLPEPWSQIPEYINPRTNCSPKPFAQTQESPQNGSAGDREGRDWCRGSRGWEDGPWTGGKFLLLKMLREGRQKSPKNKIELEGSKEVEEGKGEEEEEEGEKGGVGGWRGGM